MIHSIYDAQPTHPIIGAGASISNSRTLPYIIRGDDIFNTGTIAIRKFSTVLPGKKNFSGPYNFITEERFHTCPTIPTHK